MNNAACKHFEIIVLSIILHRDESLSGSDITSKLEPAFLSGLRCTQPLIRAKFFEVFDASMKRRVYERLLYICCSQNWEAMGSHFWIKQCIEVNNADSDLSVSLLSLLSGIKKIVLLMHKTHLSFVFLPPPLSASLLRCLSLISLSLITFCSCVCVLVSCCWQCANETPSSAPAARDPCCRLLQTSSTWPTAMTAPPSPWQHMSSRSRVRGRTVRPRRRWDTQTDPHTRYNVS